MRNAERIESGSGTGRFIVNKFHSFLSDLSESVPNSSSSGEKKKILSFLFRFLYFHDFSRESNGEDRT